MQLIGRLGLLIAIVLMLPVARLTSLHSPVLDVRRLRHMWICVCVAGAARGADGAPARVPADRCRRGARPGDLHGARRGTRARRTRAAGVLLALAVQGLPTLVLWRRHTHPTPFLGRRGPELTAIRRFALPGSGRRPVRADRGRRPDGRLQLRARPPARPGDHELEHPLLPRRGRARAAAHLLPRLHAGRRPTADEPSRRGCQRRRCGDPDRRRGIRRSHLPLVASLAVRLALARRLATDRLLRRLLRAARADQRDHGSALRSRAPAWRPAYLGVDGGPVGRGRRPVDGLRQAGVARQRADRGARARTAGAGASSCVARVCGCTSPPRSSDAGWRRPRS